MNDDRIRVLIFEPKRNPYERMIDNTLFAFQTCVGGNIEILQPSHIKESALLICNADGKNNGMTPNRFLLDKDGRAYDCVFGPFLLVRDRDDDFGSLTPTQLQRFKDPDVNGGELFW